MLEDQADGSNANPAAKAEDKRFASCFYQFYQICVNSGSRHGHNDKELAQLLEETEDFIGGSQDRPGADRGENSGNDGGGDEIEYECGEYVFQADRLPFPPHFFLFLLHPYKSKHQRNRYDCQRPRQLHDGRIFQYRAVCTVQRIPGGGRRCNGGGIVDRCSRKEPEARVSQPKHLSQRGENKRRYYIKKKNNGYGLGDFFIVRVNDRRCGRNGRTAADRRAYPNQGS